MKTNSIHGELAVCLHTCQSTGFSDLSANRLINCFQKTLESLTKKFPKFWKDDFIQVGNLALLKAAQKFPENSDPSQFFNYARKAASTAMLKFLERQAISRLNPTSLEEMILVDEEGYNYSYEVAEDKDYQNTLLTSIDINRIFSSNNLRNQGFSEREICVLELSQNGYSITEISHEIALSVSRTSKIATEVRDKARVLIGIAA